ncbi:MAG TPA: efflux RND transporter periplasmic adaptor subunit [Polyangiales bacterium]|nr:efflux RND transporter periplasmic adaptor subunit [Polyangiales bacterium]
MSEREEPPQHDLGFSLPQPAKVGSSRGLLFVVIALVAIGGAFLIGYLPRQKANHALADTTATSTKSAPRVDVIAPKRIDDERTTILPGTVTPLNQTVLYPRAQGYVKQYFVDLGDRVKEGQKLAEIETPELDQQIEQGRAQLMQVEASLGQAKANRDFANTSLERYKALRPAGVASQQDLDQRGAQALVDQSNVAVAEANIQVQRANLRRLQQLKNFAVVTAPFDGVIAARTVEPGALVTPGSTTPLFELVATNPVRVFVSVPQDLAPSVKVGMKAQVTVREYPSRVFEGIIARSAGALDPATRTMRTEVRVANVDNALLTGMYSQVSLPLASPHAVYELPASAVLADAQGTRVAIVKEGRVQLRQVVIERDQGASISIARGIDARDRVVRLATGTLTDGMEVQAQAADH